LLKAGFFQGRFSQESRSVGDPTGAEYAAPQQPAKCFKTINRSTSLSMLSGFLLRYAV
jgi:hypothetical protein